MSGETLTVLAPIMGWAASLAEAPDPAFAGGLVGAGVVIDPMLGEVRAPFDGAVAAIARTRHAVTLLSPGGAEVLVHVGVDTVALDGDGFEALVAAGDAVTAGQLLIRFDLDRVARGAPSVVSPVIVLNGGDFSIVDAQTDRLVQAGEPLFILSPVNTAAASMTRTQEVYRVETALGAPLGLHARPAAHLVSMARPFGAALSLVVGERRANLRSPSALMALGLVYGDRVVIEAEGADAQAAALAIARVIASDFGETGHEAPPTTPAAAKAVAIPGRVSGVTASPGLAVGPVFHYRREPASAREQGEGVAAEQGRLASILSGLSAALGASSAGAAGDIAAAHLALIEDHELIGAMQTLVAKDKSAAFAFASVLDDRARAMAALADPRLAARADDLLDLRHRGMALAGAGEEIIAAPAGCILVADNLYPSEMIALADQIAGLATAEGGPTSHVAILAATFGVPAIAGAGSAVRRAREGVTVVLDADKGALVLDPSLDEVDAARSLVTARAHSRAAALALAARPAHTKDGVRIEVFANLGGLDDARLAAANGAEGCGLLRTEFLFMDRETAPDEAEQTRAYQAIADALGDKPLILRTLDIGGDKPVPFLPLAPEDNPALGLRGIRSALAHPHLLRTQLRAALSVQPAGRVRIMLPMVVSAVEIKTVRAMLEEEAAALGIATHVALGAMIETPAAAVGARRIAEVADFLSIGTNDLTQYTLAMDRGNAALAASVDALHPAVLALIAQTCAGAKTRERMVGVCGALASDLATAPLLIGLGVRELSAAPGMVPELKAAIAAVTLDACEALARRVLEAASPADVRAILARQLGEIS